MLRLYSNFVDPVMIMWLKKAAKIHTYSKSKKAFALLGRLILKCSGQILKGLFYEFECQLIITLLNSLAQLLNGKKIMFLIF